MVLVLSIKDCFYKIEKSIFRSNNARYEKLSSKIIHVKETYKFCFDHFFEKRTVFILIKNSIFRTNSATYETNVKEQNYSF